MPAPTDTTYASPFSYAQVASGGLDYGEIIAVNQMLMKMGESFNPMAVGILWMVGIIGGSGADTIRVPERAVEGAGVAMTALASETDTVAPTTLDLGYTDFTVGRYGIGYYETYEQQMFTLAGVREVLNIERLMALAPGNIVATLRSLLGTTLAGISAAVGSSAAATSLDTIIAAANSFNTQYPNSRMGAPVLTLHDSQVNDVLASVRTEPGFQYTGQAMAMQGLVDSQFVPNWMGLGFDLVKSSTVTSSGGARQGAAYDRGGVGVAFGDTSRITPGVERFASVRELGLLIQELPDGARQAQRQMEARGWVGMSTGSTEVFRQTRVLGTA